MSKVKKFFVEFWFPSLMILVVIGGMFFLIWTANGNHEQQEQAEKLCYPYVVMAQTDEIVVCAGVEEPVVKKRK